MQFTSPLLRNPVRSNRSDAVRSTSGVQHNLQVQWERSISPIYFGLVAAGSGWNRSWCVWDVAQSKQRAARVQLRLEEILRYNRLFTRATAAQFTGGRY
ncbi:unnamed protein product, partial [Iphiclides podalirius]